MFFEVSTSTLRTLRLGWWVHVGSMYRKSSSNHSETAGSWRLPHKKLFGSLGRSRSRGLFLGFQGFSRLFRYRSVAFSEADVRRVREQLSHWAFLRCRDLFASKKDKNASCTEKYSIKGPYMP